MWCVLSFALRYRILNNNIAKLRVSNWLSSRLRQHTLASRTDTDPLDRDLEELLDELNVLFAVLGEVVVRGDVLDGGLPARKGDIFHLNTREELEISF